MPRKLFGNGFLYIMSLKSDNGFVGYQILAPIRTSLYSKPETVMHLTEMNVFFRRCN